MATLTIRRSSDSEYACVVCGQDVDPDNWDRRDEQSSVDFKIPNTYSAREYFHKGCYLQRQRKVLAGQVLAIVETFNSIYFQNEESLYAAKDEAQPDEGQLCEGLYYIEKWLKRNEEQVRKVAQTGEAF